MARIFIPSRGPEDWKDFLAEPEKQWRSGYSAKTLAHCWEEADGLPDSVKKVWLNSGIPLFEEMEPLLILPEYQVSLPGGSRPSQSDIFVLARSNQRLVSMTVEGKVNEPFGPTVSEWKESGSQGKRRRLKFLCERLGLSADSVDCIRYQLLHRTVSALIEADRFNTDTAVMLVHSFSSNHAWFEDYDAFLGLFDKKGEPGSITFAGTRDGISLYLSWVTGEKKFLGY